MKKYLKHAAKSVLVGYGALFSLMIAFSLVRWFITFDFPEEVFAFDRGFRVLVAWVAAFSLFIGTCLYDGRTDEEKINQDKALIDHLINKNRALEFMLKQKGVSAAATHANCNNKTTATDIALGVGVGIVGAEIVTEFLDL